MFIIEKRNGFYSSNDHAASNIARVTSLKAHLFVTRSANSSESRELGRQGIGLPPSQVEEEAEAEEEAAGGEEANCYQQRLPRLHLSCTQMSSCESNDQHR